MSTPSSSGPARDDHVFIIAEAGVNHNGSVDRALELVHRACESGADAVKFQSFVVDDLVTSGARTATYQQDSAAQTQRELLGTLALTHEVQRRLHAEAEAIGIEFMSTPFDIPSMRFLVEELGMQRIKISSADLTHGPLLLEAARYRRDMVVSTGMASLQEVKNALSVIAFGMTSSEQEAPSATSFTHAYDSVGGREALVNTVTLLHCTSAYPAPLEEVNLKAIKLLRAEFGIPIGYSDHTTSLAVPVAVTALGASVIEKHFTLDRGMVGPDHAASIEPDEFLTMVRGIREVELALGRDEKTRTTSEVELAEVARRSLVAARPIKAGEVIMGDHIGVKRPSTGRSPMDYWNVLGTQATKDYDIDDPI